VLAAVRLLSSSPPESPRRIVLIDRERHPGGRLRVGGKGKDGGWGYGLSGISRELYDFWNQTFKADPDSTTDLGDLVTTRQTDVGILSGSSITKLPLSMIASPKGARAMGGMAAQKQWPSVDEILASDAVKVERSGTAFADAWKLPRKSPATLVLEQFGPMLGIPDIWSASITALAERTAFQTGEIFSGDWTKAFDALLDREIAAGRLVFAGSSRIADCDEENGIWNLTTDGGVFRAKALVVAQPPWIATQWLPKQYWPTALLALASKTKPVSLVVLTEEIVATERPAELTDIVLIPAEGVQAIVTANQEITFQATIDFELSLQAPEVVKAVKRLKRARRKLAALLPHLMSETNRIALVPVGWAQSPAHSEHRYIDRLDAAKDLATDKLGFCGDAYGSSWNGDRNVIHSVLATCAAISGS